MFQLLWPGAAPVPSRGSEVFYMPLKGWLIQKEHKILCRGRDEHCLACGCCVASFVLSITFIRLALLTANLLQALCLGNLLFITLRISIHIFTWLRPCEKLDPLTSHLYSHSGKYFTAGLSGIITNPRNKCPQMNAFNSPPGPEMMYEL